MRFSDIERTSLLRHSTSLILIVGVRRGNQSLMREISKDSLSHVREGESRRGFSDILQRFGRIYLTYVILIFVLPRLLPESFILLQYLAILPLLFLATVERGELFMLVVSSLLRWNIDQAMRSAC